MSREDLIQFDVGPKRDRDFLGGDNFRAPFGQSIPGIGLKGNNINGLKGNDFNGPKGNVFNSNISNQYQNVDISYEGYYLEKEESPRLGEKPNWSRVSHRKLPLNDAKLLELRQKQRKETRSTCMENFERLTKDQQSVVTRLVERKSAEERNVNATWSLHWVKKNIEKNYRTRVKECKKILVILKREPRSTSRNVLASGSRGNAGCRDDIIDLDDPAPRPKPKQNEFMSGGLGNVLGGGKNMNNNNNNHVLGGLGLGTENHFGDGINNGMPKAGGKKQNLNKQGVGGFGTDNILGGGFNNGMPKGIKTQNVNNAGPGGYGNDSDDLVAIEGPVNAPGKQGVKKGGVKKKNNQGPVAGIGDSFSNETPQPNGPFPDPFAGVSLDDRFPPPPPNHERGRPQHNQKPGPPPGAIPVNDWPPPQQHHQPQPVNHAPTPPMRDHFPPPNEGNPFKPNPPFNQPGAFDLPPNLNDPRFTRPISPPRRRRSLSARRRSRDSVDDPAFMRKVQDWDINDNHSSDYSFRDDMWSLPRDKDSRRSFTPPSSPGRSDFLDGPRGTLQRSKSYKKSRRNSREYERDGYPLDRRDRERDVVLKPYRSHSPDIYRERPKRGLQRTLTDYPSGPVAERRPRYAEVDVEYASRGRRGGKYHERREREYDFEERDRDRRGGGRRMSGFW